MNPTIEQINQNLRQLRDRLDLSIGLSEKAANTLRNIFKEVEDNPTDTCQYGLCDGSGYVDRIEIEDNLKVKCPCYQSVVEQMDDNSDE